MFIYYICISLEPNYHFCWVLLLTLNTKVLSLTRYKMQYMCLIPRGKNIDRLSGNIALGLASQNWWHVIEILHYTGTKKCFFATRITLHGVQQKCNYQYCGNLKSTIITTK